MKKILSLAIILSCALTSVSWADGPGGNNHGQQQVWQQDAGRGGPNGNRQQGPQANNHQGNGDNRGPAQVRADRHHDHPYHHCADQHQRKGARDRPLFLRHAPPPP